MFHGLQSTKHAIMDIFSCADQQWNTHENSLKSIFMGYENSMIIFTMELS